MTTLPPAEIAAECQVNRPRFVAVLRRERSESLALVARLREWGIAAMDVESTVLLSKLVAAKRVELLIIDHQIEGFITGMEVVQKMRMAFVRIPVIVLGSNVEVLPQELNALGPVTFAGAGKSTEELAHLARQVLLRPPQDSDLIPKRARVLVERQHDLPVLSPLIVRLVRYFQTPVDGIPVDDMCRDIAVDPKASVVLFKAAHASADGLVCTKRGTDPRPVVVRKLATPSGRWSVPLFVQSGLVGQISSVRDAVRLLGVRRSMGHILNAAIVDAMGHLAQPLPAEQQLWHSRRGLLTASACSIFGEMERRPREAAFLSGLLQDVGMLVMLRACPRDYHAVLHRWRTVGRLNLAMVERSELGCTHAEVSAALLEHWQLPAALIVPVLHHLEPLRDASRQGVDPGLHRAKMIGEAMADLIDAPHDSRRHALESLLSHYGPREQSACRQALIRAASQATEAAHLLDLQLPGDPELETMLRSALALVPTGHESFEEASCN
jgi:HDOD domain